MSRNLNKALTAYPTVFFQLLRHFNEQLAVAHLGTTTKPVELWDIFAPSGVGGGKPIRTPEESKSRAENFRFTFYNFKTALRKANSPGATIMPYTNTYPELMKALEKTKVALKQNPETGYWGLVFSLIDNDEAFKALEKALEVAGHSFVGDKDQPQDQVPPSAGYKDYSQASPPAASEDKLPEAVVDEAMKKLGYY